MTFKLNRKCWNCGKMVEDSFDMFLSLDRQCCSKECAIKCCIERIKIETTELLKLKGGD